MKLMEKYMRNFRRDTEYLKKQIKILEPKNTP